MTTDLIVRLGGGGVIGTVLAAIVAGLFGRGKNRVDATKIITETAANLAAEVNKELQGVRAELATSRAEIKREMAAIRTSVDHLTG